MRKIQILAMAAIFRIDVDISMYHCSITHNISGKNHPIFMKFCTQQQILNWMNIT